MSRFPFDQRPTMPVPMPGPPVAPHSHHHPRLPRHFPPNQPQFVHPHSHPAHLMMPPHPPHHIRPELGSRNEDLAEERGLFHNPRNLMPDVQQYHLQHQTQMMHTNQSLGHDLMMMHNHQSLGHDLVRPMPGHEFVRPLLDRQLNVPAQAVALHESWRLDQERKSMVERFGGVARHLGAANNHSMPKMHDEMLQRYAAAPDTIKSASASGMPFQGMDFGRQDHGDVSAMRWDNPAGISRMDECSDYPQLQSQRKRIRIGADGTVTDIDDEQPLENRYHLQQPERSSADGDTAFQNDSRKRQKPASREEELLIEHGLLDDKEQSMANVGPSVEEPRGQFVPHNAETRSTYFNSGSMRSGRLVNHNKDIPGHFESYRHQAHHNALKDPSHMSSQLPAGMPIHNRAHDQDYFSSDQFKEGSKLPDEKFQPLRGQQRTLNPESEQYHQGTAAWNQAESGRQRGPPEFDSNPMNGIHLPQQQQNVLHGRANSMSGASQNSLDHSTDVYHNPGLTNHHLPYQEQRQQRSYGSRDGQQMQEVIQHHVEQNYFQNLHKSEQQLYAHGQNQFSQANAQESLPFLTDGHGVQPPRRLHGPLPNSENQLPHLYGYHPPIPPVPPPPLPPSPPRSPVQVPSPPPFPVSTATLPVSSSILSPSTCSQALPSNMKSYPHGVAQHSAPNFASVGSQVSAHPPFQKFGETGPCFPVKQPKVDKHTVVNAVDIFRPPGRATRPDRFVVILRGLPGSGKSYLAKALRDIEVSNGGTAPRIHSMDDYFMTEVEKVEENESRSTSGMLSRGKKRVPTKVIEYCYEPEMEEGYRASMLKAFKKTLEEGVFTFIIVDDRNLRVADFAQFWAVAKRLGYEVFLLEAPYKDPVGCATRNVHKFTVETVKEMADKWEIAPPLYLQLDISSLIHGDDLDGQAITEVEMDTNDTDIGEESQNARDDRESDSLNPQPRWVSEDVDTTQVKDLNSCKWSDVKDSDDRKSIESRKPDNNALSGLMQAYGKGDKSVRWADQGHKDFEKGFSIGVKCQNKRSLIIGPGAGYNEASNPISDEDKIDTEKQDNSGNSRKNKKILEQLRAEQEAFKAVRSVFDRRRQRIGGLDDEDE